MIRFKLHWHDCSFQLFALCKYLSFLFYVRCSCKDKARITKKNYKQLEYFWVFLWKKRWIRDQISRSKGGVVVLVHFLYVLFIIHCRQYLLPLERHILFKSLLIFFCSNVEKHLIFTTSTTHLDSGNLDHFDTETTIRFRSSVSEGGKNVSFSHASQCTCWRLIASGLIKNGQKWSEIPIHF